jgi:phthalate 4,5-cis-dihydrodiol dehydrogenase
MAMLSFADGAAASLVYSGYDRFDSDELHGWIGESGQPRSASHGSTHRALAAMRSSGDEARARSQRYGYGGDRKWGPQPGQRWHQPHFGTLIVSCEKADLRQSADGILIYSADGVREVEVALTGDRPGRSDVLNELYAAVANGILPVHGGRFARETLAVCLAIQESSRRRCEVALPVSRQLETSIKSGRAAWA